ncbi:hypothetical protein VOLCADRAFT_87388 [Volvox carteri f. nagariensis]|uniref:Nephrocystin 3-like N-terminal domain-containing protein n=1 Tax=Volvox carteri f. nagariensis TaxID=3068 RepID=D8TL80_VOLCA|nr:uncharacterized protein VOLCADRAFT_87388 [Volvox carteri f. nagariensis]EFJ51825.1 hypothetical protein VOLCADRAFT_87388 [Volvox carteri f. nagariensis]|eukprot:XP_002947235.1 hypothetical protein VOLCADRAFT_87388 [Volvox carteri f. nagariensis]
MQFVFRRSAVTKPAAQPEAHKDLGNRWEGRPPREGATQGALNHRAVFPSNYGNLREDLLILGVRQTDIEPVPNMESVMEIDDQRGLAQIVYNIWTKLLNRAKRRTPHGSYYCCHHSLVYECRSLSNRGDARDSRVRSPTRPKLPPVDTVSARALIIPQPELPSVTKKKLKSVLEAEPELPPALATVGKGVSLRGLRKLRAAIRKHFGDDRYSSVSTTDVCQQWVKVVTAPAGRCRLVELPGLLDPTEGDVGRPMYFISHAWSNSIELLFRKVFDFLASADDSTRVWLDVLAVCQHESNPAHKADIAAFADVVAACSGGTLVVMDLTRCNPSTRAWCVFEWAHTLAAHGPDGLHMSLAPLERAAVFADLDVERAECFRPADKEMIMREVRRQHGSPEAFNSKLKLQLLLEPLSYSVDLRRLQDRSRDTAWEFSEVERWLEGMCSRAAGAAGGCRAIVKLLPICGTRQSLSPAPLRPPWSRGAGEGKSTISAELVRRLTSPTAPRASAATPSTGGSALGTHITCAYHFLKYNDQRRLDPVRVIKTMAFQLASRIPSVCSSLFECDVAEVAQLTDVDRAFELLLLRPLQGVRQPVVIVLDALDEAEPVPFTAPAAPCAAGSTSGAEGSGPTPTAPVAVAAGILNGGGGGGAGIGVSRYPVLCGNRALQLLTKHLQRLPPEVRFFVTTRPDAASGQVVPALERTFHHQGGSIYMRPSQLVKSLALGASAEGRTAAGGGGKGGGGVMVYHTVVKACLGGEKEEEDGDTSPSAAVASPDGGGKSRRAGGGGGPLLASLLGGMASPLAAKAAALMGGHSGGGAGANLTALYRVYGKVFRKAYEWYDLRKRMDVSKLLNVLLAAQEPLSQSLVQQLGLGHAVPLLPGFPVLFYVDEHHLLTLHKSLADWLLLDAVVGSGSGASSSQLDSRQVSDKSIMSCANPTASPTTPTAASSTTSRSLLSRLHGKNTTTGNAASGGAGGGGRGGGGSNSIFQRSRPSPASRAALEGEAVAAAQAQAAAVAAANAPSPSFSMDLAQGHLLLGRYLTTTRNTSPSTYCLKYLVTHLAAAGPLAAELLDDVVSSFGFIEAVFARGYSANVIRALGTMGHSSRLSRDALRWLRAKQHDLLLATSGTAGVGAGDAVLGTALMSPIGSELYRVALRAANQGWRTRVAVPSYDEWPADQAVLKGHTGNVTSVVFSPDGRQLVSSSGGGHELRVWDISSGTCCAVLLGHKADVTCLAMSADGQVIASGSNDMTCRLWDAATGQCTAVLSGHTAAITGVAFSPPERGKALRLVTASQDDSLRMWAPAPKRPATAQQQQRGRRGSTGGLAPSPLNPAAGRRDERQRQRHSSGGLEMDVDVAMGLAVRISGAGGDDNGSSSSYTCVQVLPGGQGGLQGVAWAPDGRRLAGAHGAEVWLWALPAGKMAVTLSGHTGKVLGIAFSPNDGGRRLASCGWDQVIRLWDTRTNQCVATATGHSELVRSLSWSPDGRRLASASSDNTMRIWDVTPTLGGGAATTAAPAVPVLCTALLRQAEWMTAVSFSPDSRALASGSVAKELRLWDVAACEAEFAATCASTAAAAAAAALRSTPSSRLQGAATTAGSGGGVAKSTLDKMTQKSLKTFSTVEAETAAAMAAATVSAVAHTADVTCIALSPDGSLLATASQDKTLRLYDSVNARWLATLSGHDSCVTCVAWAPPPPAPPLPLRPSQRQLASVSHDLTVRIWDIDLGDGSQPVQATCSRTLYGHTDRIRSVAWSPAANGHLATGAEDNHVRLWDTLSGTCLSTLWGHSNYVTCVVYCPADGGRTVTSASQDGTIRVWDTASGQARRTLHGHDHYVNHVAYSACGSLLASGGCDNSVRLWEHVSGKCIAVLTGHTHFVNCVAFEPVAVQRSGGGTGVGGPKAGGALFRRLASASTDATVRVWDLRARRCVALLQGHSGPVHCVTWVRGPVGRAAAVAPGGKSGGKGGVSQQAVAPPEVASGAADHSIRLWCEEARAEQ